MGRATGFAGWVGLAGLALAVGCGADGSGDGGSTSAADGSGTSGVTDDGSGPTGGPTATGGPDGTGTTGSDDLPGTDDTGGPGPDPAGWYPGIPYPTDDLPGGIMPTLPTPGAQPGWPYDPIEIALPEPTGAANEYVVATDGDDGSAGNGGNGTVDAPRRTIPLGNFDAGTKIFVYGNGSAYGTVDFDVGEDSSLSCAGTEADPCFFVGIDTPRIGRRITIDGSTHVVIDGLSFVDAPGGSRAWGSMPVQDSSYVTVRNVELRGDGSNTNGGAAMSISNTQFLFSYRMTIHEIGSWETNASGLDVHGWRPAYGNRYLWLIESQLYHLQADGIQTGNSSNNGPQEDTSHYIWVAGNEFYENYENALDNKNSYHVVFSSNDVHDFYATEGMGANGTAVILSNNGEGPWTGYHWAIDNRLWDNDLAIRDSGSEDGERNFMVGNVVWNNGTAFVQQNNATDRECWVIHNSVFGSGSVFDVTQTGNNASLFVRRNVFSGGSIDTQSDIVSDLSDNVLFGVSVGGSWDIESGNLTDDPRLVDPAQGDMELGAGSPAIDAVTDDDPVFALFEGLYGLDIREDVRGTTRPAGGGWDLGAVEVP